MIPNSLRPGLKPYQTRFMARWWKHSPCFGIRCEFEKSEPPVIGSKRDNDPAIWQGEHLELLIETDKHSYYQIVVNRPQTLDEVTVRVEISPETFSDSMSSMQSLRSRIAQAIHSVTGLNATVELVSPQTLERFDGKAKRVVDNRILVD